MPRLLMIGDLALETGTKVNTIRFYEEIGLMPRAARTASGRRTYQSTDLRRLRFIRHVRRLGFDTREIRSFLELADHPERDCGEVTALALRQLTQVTAKISQLELLRDELERMARLCAEGTTSDCRILETLAQPD